MRRTLMAGFLGLVLAAGLLAQSGAAAAAEVEWCAEDPVISVNGTILHITTSINTSAANVGGISYQIAVPKGADARVLSVDPVPASTVTFVYRGGDEVRASVTVSAPAGIAVIVTMVGGERTVTRSGVTNQTIVLATELPDAEH